MRTSGPVFSIILALTLAVAAPLPAIPLSDIDLEWFREKPIEPDWGPDPFIPKVRIQDSAAGPTDASGESFILTAVLLGGEKPAAILNGSVVQLGETVNGHRVTRITRKSIFLRGPSGTAEVPLKPLFSFEGH